MTESMRKRAREALGEHHAKTNGKATQVERMAACGLDESEIAYCMGIDPMTLRMHYKEEMDHGCAAVVAKVGGAMIKSALRGDSNAGQFILRSRGKWVTPTKVEADVTLTLNDKRKLMDEIVQLTVARQPVTIEGTATPVPQPKKVIPAPKVPIGKLQ